MLTLYFKHPEISAVIQESKQESVKRQEETANCDEVIDYGVLFADSQEN